MICLASRFNRKASFWVQGRKNIIQRIEKAVAGHKKIVWIHAASLGEFEQGRPLLEKIKSEHPDHKVLLTFFSPSGFEARRNYAQADFIFYLPIDLPQNAREFVRIVQPVAAIFVKYEYWMNFLTELKRNKIPTYIISAIFRPKQIFFQWYGIPYRKVLGCFNEIFVQHENSKQLLANIGIHHVSVANDTRFDRVISIAKQSNDIEIVKEFAENQFCIVAGSTWFPDEQILCKYINKNKNVKLIIAPHEISENHIQKAIKLLKTKWIRYTKIVASREIDLSEFQVLIIDNIGMLSSIYRYGKVAYIGGGFGAGIHNILEAAIYGVPVVFGIRYQKFNEALELIQLKGSFSIRKYTGFKTLMEKFTEASDFRVKSGRICANYVENNAGGTLMIYEKLLKDEIFKSAF